MKKSKKGAKAKTQKKVAKKIKRPSSLDALLKIVKAKAIVPEYQVAAVYMPMTTGTGFGSTPCTNCSGGGCNMCIIPDCF
ncbi:MAG: hypothetical protein ACK5Y2_03150 [Bdellovibrionales bacterium]